MPARTDPPHAPAPTMPPDETTYRYWLRKAARLTLPMAHDVYGIAHALQDLGLAFVEVLRTLALFLLVLILRPLLLLTAPVSVPLLAWWFHKRAAQIRQARKRARQELLRHIANNADP
ncbi:MAG: hypothetical protein Q4A97_11315 [Comamonadaceae bacterium]|nr:hypothetical protein [Comamonadaceae bacterium]